MEWAVKNILFSLLFLFSPAICDAELAFDYSRSSDYAEGEEIKTDYLKATLSGAYGESIDWRVYRAYKKTDGITAQNNIGFGAGWDPKINDRWSAWFDAEVRRDQVLGIDKEKFFGAGPKVYLYKKGTDRLSLSVGILHHSISPGDYEEQRWSIRPKWSSDNFKAVFFHQPMIGNSNDYIRMAEMEGKTGEHFFIYWNIKKRSAYNNRNEQAGIRLKYKTEFFGG